MPSPPARVVWIEIMVSGHGYNMLLSPPARVVWIEIVIKNAFYRTNMSPPARVVWIEISGSRSICLS